MGKIEKLTQEQRASWQHRPVSEDKSKPDATELRTD